MITEYELYSDERRHKSKTEEYLVLGGVVCTDKGSKRLRNALSKVRKNFNLSSEMRWGKVSNKYLDAYKAWMNVFFEDPFARFVLYSVKLSGTEWNGLRLRSTIEPTHDDKLVKLFFDFLDFTFVRPSDTKRWWVYPDAGFFSKDSVLERVIKLYNRTYYGLNMCRNIRFGQSQDSKHEDLIQLSDLLLGTTACVKFEPKKLDSLAKIMLVEYWRERYRQTPITRKRLERFSCRFGSPGATHQAEG